MAESFEGQRIVVTGATGLIGKPLARSLEQAGAQVIRGTRRPVRGAAQEIYWNAEHGEIESGKLEGAAAVVHLAGENIAGRRWTTAFKEKLRASRVDGTKLISEAIAHANDKPRTFVCASAIGYYGDRGDELLTESSPPGRDFLAETCRAWEAACQAARNAGVRVVNARLGMVLSSEGGGLARMLTPFKLGLGGVVGSGKQYMSWVTLDDVVAALRFLVAHPTISGPVNITAPHPATNAEFTKTLGRVLSRPTAIPMPAFAARLAFGEMADAILLSSTRVAPQALQDAGFRFQHPALETGLRSMIAHRS